MLTLFIQDKRLEATERAKEVEKENKTDNGLIDEQHNKADMKWRRYRRV